MRRKGVLLGAYRQSAAERLEAAGGTTAAADRHRDKGQSAMTPHELRATLDRLDLSAAEAGHLLGVHRAAIYRWLDVGAVASRETSRRVGTRKSHH
jgi:hypothetical protein